MWRADNSSKTDEICPLAIVWRAANSSKIDETCPLAITNQTSLDNINTKFGENPLIFTEVIVRKGDTDVRDLPISNPKPDLYNTNAHKKLGENRLTFTQVIIRKRKYG